MMTLTISIIILVISVSISFMVGLLTRNYSTVDRLWSVLPGVYVLVWLPEFYTNTRFLIAGALIILWCIRLTTNFALKGGYKFSFKKGFTGEDYRWKIMQQKIPNRFLYELFNLLFISGFQLVLIFVFTLPLYFYGKNVMGPIANVEYLLYTIFFTLLVLEAIADIQQLVFYNRRNKAPYKNQARYQIGFNTFGLWRFSRHPNYVCEFSQWIVLYLMLAITTRSLHWSGLGAFVLTMLFAGSTILVESITSTKYEKYADWKKATSPWIPFIDMFSRIKARRNFFKF